ncbi:DELTA-thalatoxin-Avl1a-like [Chanos chanos]|uniref:DELTA-thalatoxin-Avl1a-like n=1 Tax=Chanos chanos TaxID=29144 RepID=A0A6J2UT57_CHACN|nr:DELTA-thalatoxin-Avl1a-like [Chanos chanos]
MSSQAENVAATMTTSRSCTIEIQNHNETYWLTNPKWHMISGHIHYPPQPTIQSTKTGMCTFTKTEMGLRGAVGVLTYELSQVADEECEKLVAIMFSVPFDQNLYANEMAVGVFNNDRVCNEGLYKQMYEDRECDDFKRTKAKDSGLNLKADIVNVRATMSTGGKAVIKMEIH